MQSFILVGRGSVSIFFLLESHLDICCIQSSWRLKSTIITTQVEVKVVVVEGGGRRKRKT